MEVIVTANAAAQIEKLSPRIKRQIWENIAELANFPNCTGIKKLTGGRRGQWVKRAGDYRIVFEVDFANDRIIILEVFHRGDGY
jgi:mRNA-degrading endonuclease RelE of RelBE toxin-antitoxin system